MNQNQSTPKEHKTFSTIDGNTLMAQTYEPIRFSVEKILPHGLFIFAGSPKVGKSWLSLDLCVTAATGSKLWDFQSEHGDVLYLALEDNYNRLQNRLNKMLQAKEEMPDISRLHMTTASFGLQDGLLEQIHNFMVAHSDTSLIIIDTLEHIRNGEQDKNLYACDYRDMNRLREITNKYKLTLLLIHHTRKMYDPDPLNTISGSTGLIGAVDGVFVLDKDKRTGDSAKLTIANRDTEGFCFNLRFESEKCRWAFIGNSIDGGDEDNDNLCILINDLVKDNWKGTATELSKALKEQDTSFDIAPAALTKRMKALEGFFKKEFNVEFEFIRTHGSKQISMTRTTP